MAKIHPLLRSLLTIGIILQLLYYFFFEEAVWLFFLALFCMMAGIVYSMRQNWKSSQKAMVKVQLIAMGIFLLFTGALIAIKHL